MEKNNSKMTSYTTWMRSSAFTALLKDARVCWPSGTVVDESRRNPCVFGRVRQTYTQDAMGGCMGQGLKGVRVEGTEKVAMSDSGWHTKV